ncbi:M48 family metalloprotease, partial [Laribacter hongkongensis]
MKTPLALLLAGLMAVTPVTAQINLPDLGDSAEAGFSSRDESRAGREGVVWLRAQEAMLGDAELDDYLNRLSRRLATASPDPAQHYTLFAIDDGQINAFAMPGGYIGVHTGLLLAAQSESELASVIGHEMAHVSQRHIARQLEQQGMNQLLAIGGILAAVLMASAGG